MVISRNSTFTYKDKVPTDRVGRLGSGLAGKNI